MEHKIEIIKVIVDNNLSTKDGILEIKRMGGLTNRNYLVRTKGESFVVRLPGFETEKIINRNNEGIIVKELETLSIDAPLVLFDSKTGIKVSKYINGAQTMSTKLLQNDERIIQIGNLLRRLHTEANSIEVDFDIHEMVHLYEKVINESNAQTPDNYENVKEEVIKIIESTECNDLVVSHNDPLAENFILDSNNTLFLVDWEYGGMNNPYWDISDVSLEASYDSLQDSLLLKTYFQRVPNSEEIREFDLNKLSIDLLWSLWGFLRAAQKNDGEEFDFYQYGVDRFERLESNLLYFKEKYM